MDSLFQKSLTDVVKGLRVQSINENQYLRQAFTEVQHEIKGTDPLTKATALEKLIYISMFQGVDTGWASFHCLEVMSLARFSLREIGYLGACSAFQANSSVLLLAINLLKKDLNHARHLEVGLALNCLANILTLELARELLPEAIAALGSSKPYVRKRACLVLYKFFENDPEEAPRRAFKPLTEKLADADPSVVCATVNVICEVVTKSPNPEAYLPLAPDLYRLLTTSDNNWIVIKIVKIFGYLAPLEPRLARKLEGPLSDIMKQTPAKSLLLECIKTSTLGIKDSPDVISLCMARLQELLQDTDPNLKYLALKAMLPLLSTHKHLVAVQRATVLTCLSDPDPTIQQIALQLVEGIVTEESLQSTMNTLLQHVEHATDPSFREALVSTMLQLCSYNHYSRVHDFAWYVETLARLARIEGSQAGLAVGHQLVDVTLRVEDVRKDAVRICLRHLLQDPVLLVPIEDTQYPTVHHALASAAWVVGEYADEAQVIREAVEALLQPRTDYLSPQQQAVYMQALLKLVLRAALLARPPPPEEASSPKAVEQSPPAVRADAQGPVTPPIDSASFSHLITSHLSRFAHSVNHEVQDRACNVKALLALLFSGRSDQPALFTALSSVLSEDLKPVSAAAQSLVPLPEGLDLERTLESLDSIPGVAESASQGEQAGATSEEPSSVGEEKLGSSAAEVRQRHSQYYLPREKGLGEDREEGVTDKSEDPGSMSVNPPPVKPRPPRAIVKLEDDMPEIVAASSAQHVESPARMELALGPFEKNVVRILQGAQGEPLLPRRKHRLSKHAKEPENGEERKNRKSHRRHRHGAQPATICEGTGAS